MASAMGLGSLWENAIVPGTSKMRVAFATATARAAPDVTEYQTVERGLTYAASVEAQAFSQKSATVLEMCLMHAVCVEVQALLQTSVTVPETCPMPVECVAGTARVAPVNNSLQDGATAQGT